MFANAPPELGSVGILTIKGKEAIAALHILHLDGFGNKPEPSGLTSVKWAACLVVGVNPSANYSNHFVAGEVQGRKDVRLAVLRVLNKCRACEGCQNG